MDNPETLTTFGTQETGRTMIGIALSRNPSKIQINQVLPQGKQPCSNSGTRRVLVKRHERHLLWDSTETQMLNNCIRK